MPVGDPAVAAPLMMAAVGQMATPARLVMAAIRIAGGASEGAVTRAGFGPLIEAMLAHAQNQIPPLSRSGVFADMDLACRSLDRFHRLMRAVTGYVELGRTGRWATIAAALTKMVSERLDPKLRDVASDLNNALRRREAGDRLDAQQLLAALNGIYLLGTVRDSRDSLALNALFDQVWAQTGQALEMHIERLLEALRANPADSLASARLEAAAKMAHVRFNADYADTLRRAKDAAERRVS
jgi:predicted lipoprotein